jgi:hypothetical protein
LVGNGDREEETILEPIIFDMDAFSPESIPMGAI